jgi:DNA-binding PadR family transcriptional regulator
MTVSEAQLRTLRLRQNKAARRVYRSGRAGEYSWKHEDAPAALTPTLHKLFSSGHATVSPENRDMAVITHKGRAVLAARGTC